MGEWVGWWVGGWVVGEWEGRRQVSEVGGELGGGEVGEGGLATRGVVEGVWNFQTCKICKNNLPPNVQKQKSRKRKYKLRK